MKNVIFRFFSYIIIIKLLKKLRVSFFHLQNCVSFNGYYFCYLFILFIIPTNFSQFKFNIKYEHYCTNTTLCFEIKLLII